MRLHAPACCEAVSAPIDCIGFCKYVLCYVCLHVSISMYESTKRDIKPAVEIGER